MVQTTRVELTGNELNLIKAIRAVEYGQLNNVEIIEGGERQYSEQLTEPQKRLLTFIRNGNRFFHVLMIHQADPQYGDYPVEFFGFEGRKRAKFN